MMTFQVRSRPRERVISAISLGTSYPTPRVPNSPKYEKSLRICAALRSIIAARSFEETRVTPLACSSRSLRR